MRAVVKQGTGGHYLQNAHRRRPSTRDEARTRWRAFGPHKQDVMDCLLAEQYQLCCYSEVRADLLGLGYHIEHVWPKSLYWDRTFDYDNLAASALNSEDLHGREEVFGGHAKAGNFDPLRFVSCHRHDCARFFSYLSDGRVVPAVNLGPEDMACSRYTIDLLNLNSPFLITQRQQWWDELEKYYEQHGHDGWSVEHLAAVDLVPLNGALSPFFSLTRQFFGPVAEQVLQQQASQLR